ncbi:type VI-B CRISPR accessory protein Csx27 [Myroides odoratimimus]|uniref:type VI-B CRISPR accessory protein Csx27 n=1 Tax=Myroides odoratimimus TaxID=76832 RepID=UPI001CE14770|nr:CRISPR-associated protein Csx27 [Myroides odoratimimus]MCA4806652.1 hypothetical protein [Myroides odoratimimus]MDM1499522.1 hypothetical protein [Myroides odoratimimus]
MDKLSLYELFSFVIPGGIALHLLNWCSINVLSTGTLFNLTDLSNSLIALVFALLIGVALHIITFNILLKWSSYRQIIYKSVQQIKLDDYIQQVIPFLNQEYFHNKKHEVAANTNNAVPAENLFDYAYYYLEVNGKNAQAKNFQSLYFFFRNMFTLGIVSILILITALVYSTITSVGKDVLSEIVLKIAFFAVIIGIAVPVANWLRKKMIITVFGCYYADRVHQTNK